MRERGPRLPKRLRASLVLAGLAAIGSCAPSFSAGSSSGGADAHGSASEVGSSADPVFVGAGDIASCDDLSGAEATAKLIDRIPGTVFAVGDLAYPDGTDQQFAQCYEPTWGRFKNRTRPAPGNHEYNSDGASGYTHYWGAVAGDPAKGYYSYELGRWHILSLNSECQAVGGCDPSSPELQWLRRDLAAHPGVCTLAYFHKPLFTSGAKHGHDPEMKPFWDALYAAHADIVIGGHDHHYERFALQDPGGKADTLGIRQFVVGTGGKNSHRSLAATQPNSESRNADTYGVLKLTLHPASYDWEFVPEEGKTFTDGGSETCHAHSPSGAPARAAGARSGRD